ncbi:MAG: hypothetical protein PHC56_10265, partial [Herbinix sp.]|nr:hypothetical protein [Herbinix sp.]
MGDVVANTISFSIMLILWVICPYQAAKYMLRLNIRRRIWYKLILFLIFYSAVLVIVEIFTPFWQSEYGPDEMTIMHVLVDKTLMYILFFICTLIMIKEKWYYSALYSIASFSFFTMIIALVSYSIGIIFQILKFDISNQVVDFI